MEDAGGIFTHEEKAFSLIGYLFVLICGLLVPFIIWAVKKKKSDFIRFHSLQSIFLFITITILIILVRMSHSLFLSYNGHNTIDFIINNNLPNSVNIINVIFLCSNIIIGVAGFLSFIYFAAVSGTGKLAKVPFIGNIIYEMVYKQD